VNYTLKFLISVENEALNAYFWYEEKSKGLGEDFLRVFYANAWELIRYPLIYKKIYKDFRRRLMRRFPYAIYFYIDDHEIIVHALLHTARNPKILKTILKK
jgi:toxin ParE1/3/4